MKYNNDLILPIENIDGDERSIMDGLMCDFVETMVKLGTAIADDEKWGKDVVLEDTNKDAPIYTIRKTSMANGAHIGEAIVVFGFEIYGRHSGTIGICRNYDRDTATMSMSGMEWVNGFSAIAAAFARLYRKNYAEIHNA